MIIKFQFLVLRCFTFILFCCHFTSFSQSRFRFKEDTTKKVIYKSVEPIKTVILGFETAGILGGNIDSVTGNPNRYSLIRWEPHISYYPKNNIGFGLVGKIEHFQSNFLPDIQTLFEIGIMTRIFVPFRVNNSIFKDMTLSIEASLSRANYNYFDKTTEAIYNSNMSQTVLRVPLILTYNLYKNVNKRYSYRYINFLNKYARFESSIGIEYLFIKKEK